MSGVDDDLNFRPTVLQPLSIAILACLYTAVAVGIGIMLWSAGAAQQFQISSENVHMIARYFPSIVGAVTVLLFQHTGMILNDMYGVLHLLIPCSQRVPAYAAVHCYGRPERRYAWCGTLAKCQWRIFPMARRIRHARAHFLVFPTVPVRSIFHSELESCAARNDRPPQRNMDFDTTNVSSSSTDLRLYVDGDVHSAYRLSAKRKVNGSQVGSRLNRRLCIVVRPMQCLEVLRAARAST